MPENRLLSAAGGLDTSSYPTAAAGNKLLPPPDMLAGASQAIGIVQQLQNLDSTKFDLAGRQNSALQGAFSSILQNPTIENVTRRATELRTMGVPASVIANGLAEFSTAMDPNTRELDPRKASQIAINHLSQLGTVAEKLELAGRGRPQFLNNGKENVPVVPRSGMNPTILPGGGAAIPNKFSPVERATTIETAGPTGGKTAIPRGEVFDDYGDMRGAPPLPPARPQSGTGSYSPAPTRVTTPQGDVMNVPSPLPTPPGTTEHVERPPGGWGAGARAGAPLPRGLPVALPPSAVSDYETSTRQFTTERDDIPASRQRLFVLEQANAALRGTDTGKGTATRNAMFQAIAALPGGIGKYISGDPEKLSNYDLATKFTAAVQMNQPGAGRSDAAQGLSGASTPNPEMNPAAAKSVLADMIGAEKLKQSRIKHYISSGADPAHYANHVATEWDHDVRAYGLGAMDSQERAALFQKLSPADRKRFYDSIRAGIRSGALRSEDLQGTAGGR